MHIEMDDKTIFIFVNKNFLILDDWDNKESIAKNMKKFILKLNLNYDLSLRGFYRVNVYINEAIGTFIEIYQMDDFNTSMIDLRMCIYTNESYLLETEDYHYLEPEDVYYHKGKFYIELEQQEHVLRYIELGKLIYGEEKDEIMTHWMPVKIH